MEEEWSTPMTSRNESTEFKPIKSKDNSVMENQDTLMEISEPEPLKLNQQFIDELLSEIKRIVNPTLVKCESMDSITRKTVKQTSAIDVFFESNERLDSTVELEQLFGQLQLNLKENQQLYDHNAEINEKLAQQKARIDQLEFELENSKKEQNRLVETNQLDVDRLKESIFLLEQQLKEQIDTNQEQSDEISELNNENSRLNDESSELQVQLEQTVKAKEALAKFVKEKTAKIDQFKVQMSSVQSKYDESVANIDQLNKELQESQATIDQLNEEASESLKNIDQLNIKIKESHKNSDQLKKQLQESHKRNESLTNELEEFQATIDDLQERLDESAANMDQLKEDLQESRDTIDQLKVDFEDSNKNEDQLEKELQESRACIDQLNADLCESNETINQLEKELQESSKKQKIQVDELQNSMKTIELLHLEELKRTNSEIDQLTRAVDELQQISDSKQELIDNQSIEIENLAKILNETSQESVTLNENNNQLKNELALLQDQIRQVALTFSGVKTSDLLDLATGQKQEILNTAFLRFNHTIPQESNYFSAVSALIQLVNKNSDMIKAPAILEPNEQVVILNGLKTTLESMDSIIKKAGGNTEFSKEIQQFMGKPVNLESTVTEKLAQVRVASVIQQLQVIRTSLEYFKEIYSTECQKRVELVGECENLTRLTDSLRQMVIERDNYVVKIAETLKNKHEPRLDYLKSELKQAKHENEQLTFAKQDLESKLEWYKRDTVKRSKYIQELEQRLK